MNMEKLQPLPHAPPMYPQIHQQQQQQQVPSMQMPPVQIQPLHPQHFQVPPSQGNNEGYEFTNSNQLAFQIPQQENKTDPGQSQAPVVFVVNNKAPVPLGPEPQRMECPHCNVKMMTRMDFRSTRQTHFGALAIALTGCFFLAPFVYCCKCCKRHDHYCTNCDQYIGKYRQ